MGLVLSIGLRYRNRYWERKSHQCTYSLDSMIDRSALALHIWHLFLFRNPAQVK